MKLSVFFISMLCAIAMATACNYFEDVTGVNLIALRCTAGIVGIVGLCMSLHTGNEYDEKREGAY